MSPPSVYIYAFAGMNPFLFSISCSIFNIHLPEPLFQVHTASLNDGDIVMDGDMIVRPDKCLDEMARSDIIIVPGWPAFEYAPGKEAASALCAAHANGAVIVGLCYGAYALAYAGLLNGKNAATHWLAEEDFRERFPGIDLNSNSLYVEDDRIITSAGMAAGIDCCIYIVSRFYSYREANALARIMVASPYREGGQSQFINIEPKTPCEPAILAVTEFLKTNIRNNYTINDLAIRFAMSRRTLIRHFEKVTGMSIKKWVIAARLKRASELLEETGWSIERIACEAGFGSANSLRHHFVRRYGLAPQHWRERFFNQSRQ